MVAPTFKKATDTDAGDATKYGAPDVKYAFDVLDGTHATDRVQSSVIEGDVASRAVIFNASKQTVASAVTSTELGHLSGALSNIQTQLDGKAALSHTHSLADITDDGALAAKNTIATADIDNDAVTYAKIQNVSATDRILGRDSAGAGDIEEITPAALRTMINVADGANNYVHPNHTGDVTSVGDGAQTIANDVVTDAKLRNSAATSVIGRSAGTVGDPADIAASADGQYLKRASGALSFAAITAGDLPSHTHAGEDITSGTVADARLSANVVREDIANTYGAFDQTFPSSRLLIQNPAATFAYVLVGSAITANRNLTLPLLTGDDTLAVLGLAQTFSGTKTFSGGITMSGSDISIGTNKITSTDYQIYQENKGWTGVVDLWIQATTDNITLGETWLSLLPSLSGSNRSAGFNIYNETNPNNSHFLSMYSDQNSAAFTITSGVVGTGGTQGTTPSTINYSVENATYVFGRQVGTTIGFVINRLGSSASQALAIEGLPLGAAGQRDSDFLRIQGYAFDSSSHTTDWKQEIDVTSNAGASTYRWRNRIDAAAYATKLSIGDDGLLTLAGNLALGSNKITVTSGATGDILKHDGTGFVRLARGSALQVLRVNSAGTDLEYAAIAAGGTLADVKEGGSVVSDNRSNLDFNANDFNITDDAGNSDADIAINRNAANGIAGLDASGDLAKTEQHPQTAYRDEANAWGTNNQNIAATGKWQEGGTNISPIGKHDIPVGATAMWPTVTAGCAALAKTELATNDINIQTLDFDQTTEENAQFSITLPRNYNNGTVTAFLYWTAASGTGGVVWGIKAVAASDDDALDRAFGSEVTVADTLITTNDLHRTAETGAITIGGTPADGDDIQFNIARKVGNASDTLTADAKLIRVVIVITTDAAVAA